MRKKIKVESTNPIEMLGRKMGLGDGAISLMSAGVLLIFALTVISLCMGVE